MRAIHSVRILVPNRKTATTKWYPEGTELGAIIHWLIMRYPSGNGNPGLICNSPDGVEPQKAAAFVKHVDWKHA